MYFQLINATDTEAVFAQCKNAYSTAAITIGQAVVWGYNGTSDGLAVLQPVTAKLALIAGIVATTSIAVSDVGRVQVYGHNTSALVSGGTDVAIGDKLTAKTGVFNLIKAANTAWPGQSGVVVAGQAFTTSTAAAKKVFVRCL